MVSTQADLFTGEVTNFKTIGTCSQPLPSLVSLCKAVLKEFVLDVPPPHFKADRIRRYDRQKKAFYSVRQYFMFTSNNGILLSAVG